MMCIIFTSVKIRKYLITISVMHIGLKVMESSVLY